MKIFLSDLHLSDGKERDDFQYHKEFDELVRNLSGKFDHIEMILLGDILTSYGHRNITNLKHNPLPRMI